MSEPYWLTKPGVLALHDRTIAEHGGPPGIRDEGLIEAALARAQNHFAYEGQRDLASLAAVYAAAITSNHPFVDGNKRAAFFVIGVFLEKNGMRLVVDQVNAALTVLRLAAGELGADEMAAWIAAHAVPNPPGSAAV